MICFESDKGTADVPLTGGRVILRMPFDERWRDTIEWQAAIGGNGHLPMERPTAHHFNIAQGKRRRRRRDANIVGSTDPGRQPRRPVREFLIELEPARTIGIRGSGINRKYFKIQVISQPKHAVVSPHARMLTSGLRRHAKSVANILNADFQRWRRHDYVVDM